MREFHRFELIFVALVALPLASTAQPTISATDPGVVISFNAPFLFSYGSWDKRARIEDGAAVLSGVGITGQGGAGQNLNLDLSAQPGDMPALRLQVGPGNKVPSLLLMLRDRENHAGTWDFTLPAPGAVPMLVAPKDAAPWSQPTSLEKNQPLDISHIVQWQIQGDWTDQPLDVRVDAVYSTAPDAAALQARATRAAQAQAALEQKARDQKALMNRYKPGMPGSPRVVHVSLAAPGILSLQIQAGRVIPGSLASYTPQPGDQKRVDKNKAGEIDRVVLIRQGHEIGWLIGPRRDQLVRYEGFEGDPLLEFVADDVHNFSLTSTDDASYRQPTPPEAVYRKSKPDDWQQPGGALAMRHILYLKLPHPLQNGKAYRLSTGPLNLQTPIIPFTLDLARTRSEAVHVNQIGYRPDDPVKRAFLSIWLGTGGAYAYPAGLTFTVVDDASGKTVYSGKVEMDWPASQPEHMWKDHNFNNTDVYRMDFSDLKTPGRYRVVVNGIGCSYPFEIRSDVWERAFKIQMTGLYNQRSGVTIGPPYSQFRKPRDFFPGDGAKVYQSRYSDLDGGNAQEQLEKLSTGSPMPNAWGGYMDAGDWNPRRVTHMAVTRAQLEVFELFPRYFKGLDLNIPRTPGIPDILTEAMFEIDCFRRLQKPDGGIPFGIETNGDPRDGEVSWLQSMPAYVYAPDARSSYYYAAVAAQAARVLRPYSASLSNTYRQSAVRAMEWAEAQYAQMKAAGQGQKIDWTGRDDRNLAALELLALTHDPKWSAIFKQDSFLTRPGGQVYAWGVDVQDDAAFLYARIDAKLTDPILREKARQAILDQANAALSYASGNAWNLTTPDKGKPMFQGFYTTPDAIDLARAHYLTRDVKYLRGAVQATQFQSGDNPENMTFTTGMGQNPPLHPLKLDARRTGQKAPVGLTVYGPRDHLNWPDWSRWVFDYYLNKELAPALPDWPAPEAYFDIFLYPSTNEFTVDTWAPNIYVWGYLAARQ